jgi:hypothetical protein
LDLLLPPLFRVRFAFLSGLICFPFLFLGFDLLFFLVRFAFLSPSSFFFHGREGGTAAGPGMEATAA